MWPPVNIAVSSCLSGYNPTAKPKFEKRIPAKSRYPLENFYQLLSKFRLLTTFPFSVMTDNTQPAQKVLLFQLQAASSRVTS